MEALEAYLDEDQAQTKPQSPRPNKAPSPIINVSAAEAVEFASKSNLTGWSPNNGAMEASLNTSLDALSLGQPAIPVKPEEESEAAKAARKAAKKKEFDQKTFKKKPKLTKAERRALQEQQRAEKAARGDVPDNKKAKTPTSNSSGNGGRSVLQYDDSKRMAKKSKEQIVHRTKTQKQVALFSHLPQYERESSLSLNVGFSSNGENNIHASILSLGLKYGDHLICGANSRAVAILDAFKQVIQDYRQPQDKALSWDLDRKLKPLIQFLIECRPHSITMGNAIKYVRQKILNLPPEMSESEAKEKLCTDIDDFVRTQIVMAQEELISVALTKIVDGDVILTYSRSHVVEQLLLQAFDLGRSFKVIVVGTRPGKEGEDLVKRLASHGLECIFIALTSVSYMMSQVTKVVVGAGAMLSNGTVLSKAGTAMVANVAHAFNKPVLVCCETYKFSERVQLDSICYNELGDPDELILPRMRDGDRNTQDPLSDWRDLSQMKLLNLVYDVTPMEYVTMVITEIGMIPPTSVPVIIRERTVLDEAL